MVAEALWVKKHKLNHESLEGEQSNIERKIQKLVDRIVQTDSVSVINAYKNSIKELEQKKATLKDKFKNRSNALPDFETAFNAALKFLSNPHRLLVSERLADKRTTLKLVFSDLLTYHSKKWLFEPQNI